MSLWRCNRTGIAPKQERFCIIIKLRSRFYTIIISKIKTFHSYQCNKLRPCVVFYYAYYWPFSTWWNFPRGTELFSFFFFQSVLSDSSQTKKNSAAPGKCRFAVKSLAPRPPVSSHKEVDQVD